MTKMRETKQIARIRRGEELFDRISAEVARLKEALDRFDALQPEIGELSAYYTGKLWKKDFKDDAAGRLPEGLKRGVLSEDGVYDLLVEIDTLRARLNALPEED